MARSQEALYFPALDKCLKGEQPIISWRTAYSALCDLDEQSPATSLAHFFQDEQTRHVLQNPLLALGPPSSKSKSDFETKTAAINVLPSNTGQYDIAELKSDALWLSKEANLGEDVALRIVIVEWQQRATASLLTQWAEEEVVLLENTIAGPDHGAIAAIKELQVTSSSTASDRKGFESDDARRKRIIGTYYIEKEHVLRVSEAVAGMAQPPSLQAPGEGKKYSSLPWLDSCAKSTWKGQCASSSAQSNTESFFVQCVGALRTRIDVLSDETKWPEFGRRDLSAAISFSKSLLSELISILRLSLLHAQADAKLKPAEDVLAWFELLDSHMFFSEIPSIGPEGGHLIEIIHCLVSIVSTTVLNAPLALEYLHSTYSDSEKASYPELASKPYLESEECTKLLTTCLLAATANTMRHAGPPILAWTIVAQRVRDITNAGRPETIRQLEDGSSDSESPTIRRSSLRDTTLTRSRPDIILDTIMDTAPGEDPIAAMANGAADELKVFDVMSEMSDIMLQAFGKPTDLHTTIVAKVIFFDLIRDALPSIAYSPDIVTAILAMLSYNVTTTTKQCNLAWPSEPANSLLDDTDIIGPRLMEHVTARYPYELSPMLSCLGALSRSIASVGSDGSRIVDLLDNLSSLTTMLPANFNAYDLVQEEEMPNSIRLMAPLPLFIPVKRRQFEATTDQSNQLVSSSTINFLQEIPAETPGKILSYNRPLVVNWQMQHSGLEHLGLLLSTRMSSTVLISAASNGYLDMDTATDILALISSLMEGLDSVQNKGESKHLLGRLSNALPRSDDIVRVVFEIFEETLQEQMARPGDETSIALLSSCVRFFQNTMAIYPERVWSFLGRSRFLAINETSSAFAAIVGATEVGLARYSFLRSCISLFRCLVHDTITRAVSRNTGETRAVTRFENAIPSQANTPEKTMSLVLLTFESNLVDVLQSQINWRFLDYREKQEIQTSILSALNMILECSYGLEEATEEPRKLTGPLDTASQALVETFISQRSQTQSFQPLLDIFTTAVATLGMTTDSLNISNITPQMLVAARFCDTLLRVGMLLGQKSHTLIEHLFRGMPLLARLYAGFASCKEPVASLITALIRSANEHLSEPPSLLGHLAPDSTKAFLSIVSQLDTPLNKLETEVHIWDMLSAIVSGKQQWLAICLLTGSTPRDRLKNKEDKPNGVDAKPLLTFALDHLSRINSLPPRRAVAMLAFVAHAQNHWAWATNSIGAHEQFVPAMTDWLSGLSGSSKTPDTEASIRTANENQIAAFVADIFATHIHGARQSGNEDLVKQIIPKISYLYMNGTAVDGYNHSLHKNLTKNFSQKFTGCSLANFKRASLRSAEFGRDYYYDLKLADSILAFQPFWNRGKGQGFIDEIARANVNLSLVESQIALLKSWKSLVIELSASVRHDSALRTNLARVASGCLKTNMESSIPSMIFENVVQIRAEIAFVVLQQLVNVQAKESEVRDVVYLAWDALRTCGQDFEIISTSKDADYYRTLLQILFLSLQPHVYNPLPLTNSKSSSQASASGDQSRAQGGEPVAIPALNATLLEILQKVIALNFRALCSSVHASASDDSSSISRPSDFVLLTAILQTILRIPATTGIHQQIATIVADTSLIRYATSLYSWSDSLGPDTADPIYGELSILLVLSLSTIPLVASQMAVEGILSHISTATISQPLRSQIGKGPFDPPLRLHSIWTRGILPLCLNLLEHVGPGLAGEISSFLNSFGPQLRRAQSDLEAGNPTLRTPHAGSITLAVASETHSLCLLAVLIEKLRIAGPSVGIAGMEVPSLEYDRVAVREEVEGLLRGRRALRERIVPMGEREGAWIRTPAKNKSEGVENLLEERIVAELEGARTCLAAL